ncbi:antibiotic biosynthesis monooxygenase [Pontibacter sp. JH31]|uniref:Antibiotic biosynthesis monooxygenase n=1 Tax=Pontibacter aquaedesilientis TaxID=2766980 RepID=A0ABR7XL55_9BACT|nr:antibiotic biosynthesis monooxygenase family protein [Pontibacter aquaedesilientis]MBD1399032.1 antibiotic biosynthesis monooxygenase [Pontibacter aquaedesilientis]
MSKKYGLHGKLKATAGNGEKLAAILLEASQLVSTAKGCHLYLISKDRKEEEAVWVTEVWDSKEDHDNSLNVEGVRALISQAMPILDGMPQKGQELEILGGAGIAQ